VSKQNDLHTHMNGVVNEALKAAAMGEPYRYHLSFSFAPQLAQDGMPMLGQDAQHQFAPYVASWFLIVQLRGNNPGEHLGLGYPINDATPSDEILRQVATGLLTQVRAGRDQKQQTELEQARAAFKQQMAAAEK
jgi:hypothetical protein